MRLRACELGEHSWRQTVTRDRPGGEVGGDAGDQRRARPRRRRGRRRAARAASARTKAPRPAERAGAADASAWRAGAATDGVTGGRPRPRRRPAASGGAARRSSAPRDPQLGALALGDEAHQALVVVARRCRRSARPSRRRPASRTTRPSAADRRRAGVDDDLDAGVDARAARPPRVADQQPPPLRLSVVVSPAAPLGLVDR